MGSESARCYALLSNYRLIDQALSKDQALVGPLQTFLDNCSRSADAATCFESQRYSGALQSRVLRTNHGPSLVVEVAQNDMDTLILLPKEVLYRYLDIVEGDIGGACGWGV